MFNPLTYKPHPAYYSFVAFNELYSLGDEVEVELDVPGVYAVAATNGKRGALVITNLSGKPLPLAFNTAAEIEEYRITTEGECDRKCRQLTSLPNESTLTVRFTV